MNMYSEAQSLLLQGNYQELTAFYEQKIENDSDNIDNYWYLGLGYLFLGKDEEAQTTWFLPFSMANDTEIETYTNNLIAILETEATRQEFLSNYQLAWLIRCHIREIEPNNLPNLINLIYLDATLEYPTISKFKDWQVIKLLDDTNIVKLSEELIIKVINKIVPIISQESLDFARICLQNFPTSNNLVQTIANIAKKINLVTNEIIYPAELINLCREKHPEDLALMKALFVIYADDIEYYHQAQEIALEFLDKSDTLCTDIFGLRQLLYLYLRNYNWPQGKIIAQEYIEKLNLFANQKSGHIEGFIASVLPILPHQLLSLQDQPRLNRYIFNQFSSRFEQITINLGYIGFQYKSYDNILALNRPLRIGYIGHTFRSHSVGWLGRWLINYHDHLNFEIFIYSLTNSVDQITEEWFIKKVNKFHRYPEDTYYENIVQQIRDDVIDILIDVDSITLNSTCEVMVHKAAPIQVTWLGLDASGIPAIDYFIADPLVLPENAQEYYSEKIWRLPETYLGVDGFEVGVPTLKREDLNIEPESVIFMNIQGPLKLHPDILRLQMRIIKNVPNSYLLVKGKYEQPFLKELYIQLAEEEGINLDRLRFLPNTKTELEHRANLKIADVVLDTYPYNGATTTLETLWMEIPLVTRVGEQFAARNSYAFMMNAGITEGIAWSDQEYIDWGIRLGKDEDLRAKIAWKLRQSKKTSPLWNGKKFTLEMENAYRQMWEISVKENQKKV